MEDLGRTVWYDVLDSIYAFVTNMVNYTNERQVLGPHGNCHKQWIPLLTECNRKDRRPNTDLILGFCLWVGWKDFATIRGSSRMHTLYDQIVSAISGSTNLS